VDHKQRHKKVRLPVGKPNKEHKKQAKKIDILCNDFIAAQKEFIKRLDTISFAANFYESIVGTTELSSLLYTASKFIKDEIPDANIGFFLRQKESFELHMFASEQNNTVDEEHLEDCFTAELVDNIRKSNKICSLEDMFALGLEGNLIKLNKLSVATIPLGQLEQSPGFILIYRSSQNKLTAGELNNISSITSGLSRAIHSCEALLPSSD